MSRECIRNLDLQVQVHPGELWVSKQGVHIELEASKSVGAKGDVTKICGFVHPLILRPKGLFYRKDCTCKSKFLTHSLQIEISRHQIFGSCVMRLPALSSDPILEIATLIKSKISFQSFILETNFNVEKKGDHLSLEICSKANVVIKKVLNFILFQFCGSQ